MTRMVTFKPEHIPLILSERKQQTRRIVRGYHMADNWHYDPERQLYHFACGDKLLRGLRPPLGLAETKWLVQEPTRIDECSSDGYQVRGVYTVDEVPFDVRLTDYERSLFVQRKFPFRSTAARYMYRSLARIRLVVLSVYPQHFSEITEKDAHMEGRASLDDFLYRLRQVYPEADNSWFWAYTFTIEE